MKKNGYCRACGWRFKTTQTDPARIHGPCPKCAVEDRFEIDPRGFGDWVAKALRRIGITKNRWLRVVWWLKGRPAGGCGCEQRQEKLNRFGDRLAAWRKRWFPFKSP